MNKLIHLAVYTNILTELLTYAIMDTQLSVNHPSIIIWENQNQQKQSLLIYNINTQTSLIAHQSFSLAAHFEIDYSTRKFSQSEQKAKVYDFREIYKKVQVTYIHSIQDQVISSGTIASNGEQISKIFNISPSKKLQNTYHHGCGYMHIPNGQQGQFKVYEIEQAVYSKNSQCFVLSPMSQQFWNSYQCETLTPKTIIEQQLYIKHYQKFIIKQNTLEIALNNHEASVVIQFPQNKVQNYSLIPFLIKQQLNIELQAIWQKHNQSLKLIMINNQKDFVYTKLKCVSNGIDYCNKSLIFLPEQQKQIFPFIPGHQNSILIEIEGLKAKNSLSLSIDRHSENIQIINQKEQQEKIQEIKNTSIIIGLIIGGLVVFMCFCCGCCIVFRKRRNKKRQNDSKQDEKYTNQNKVSSLAKLEQIEKSTSGKSSKGFNGEQNLDNISFMPPLTTSQQSFKPSPRKFMKSQK